MDIKRYYKVGADKKYEEGYASIVWNNKGPEPSDHNAETDGLWLQPTEPDEDHKEKTDKFLSKTLKGNLNDRTIRDRE